MGRLLCRLGLHAWVRRAGYSMGYLIQIEGCRRCDRERRV